MKFALFFLAASLFVAGCSSTAPARVVSREPLLDVVAHIAEDAPTITAGGVSIRTSEHRVALHAGCPVSVELTSDMEAAELDLILEARPCDGRPDETRLSDMLSDGELLSRFELVPERDGEWILLVGDEQGRAGSYRIVVRRIFEREVLVAQDDVEPTLTGFELPANVFCPLREGRRYRVDVTARGFPPHLVIAGPGMPVIESNDRSIEFVAARSGHAVVQVASLSFASGPFELRVVELW